MSIQTKLSSVTSLSSAAERYGAGVPCRSGGHNRTLRDAQVKGDTGPNMAHVYKLSPTREDSIFQAVLVVNQSTLLMIARRHHHTYDPLSNYIHYSPHHHTHTLLLRSTITTFDSSPNSLALDNHSNPFPPLRYTLV